MQPVARVVPQRRGSEPDDQHAVLDRHALQQHGFVVELAYPVRPEKLNSSLMAAD